MVCTKKRMLLISERVVAVRRIRDAWLAVQSGGRSSSSVIQKGQESAGQRTTDGRMQLTQRQGLEWLMCAFNKMKEQRSIGEIPDMLTRWRRSLQLASAVGTKMVTAVRTVSVRQLRKQRRKFMREVAIQWVTMQQTAVKSSVHRWRRQMGQEEERCASALVGATSCLDAVLCTKVWRKLVESFWVQRNDRNEGWRIERKKERGDGRGEGKAMR